MKLLTGKVLVSVHACNLPPMAVVSSVHSSVTNRNSESLRSREPPTTLPLAHVVSAAWGRKGANLRCATVSILRTEL